MRAALAEDDTVAAVLREERSCLIRHFNGVVDASSPRTQLLATSTTCKAGGGAGLAGWVIICARC